MTDIYTQENGSKKKFLAPLLVILLCMVSLTAAGYAYSATVDNTGDDVVIEGISLELKDGDDPVTAAMFNIAVDSYTHTVNGKAIIYNETASSAWGFTTATARAHPADYEQTTLNTFANGYYVEVVANDVAVGFNGDDVYADNAAFIAGKDKLTQIGDVYTLIAGNDTSASINVTMKASGTMPTFEGLKRVYLVAYTGNEITTETIKAITWLGAAEAATIASVAAGEDGTYSIAAYVQATDFLATAVPEIPSESNFVVQFAAASA